MKKKNNKETLVIRITFSYIISLNMCIFIIITQHRFFCFIIITVWTYLTKSFTVKDFVHYFVIIYYILYTVLIFCLTFSINTATLCV